MLRRRQLLLSKGELQNLLTGMAANPSSADLAIAAFTAALGKETAADSYLSEVTAT